MKLDKSSLELVLNPATGSAFYVLGKTSELFCGFRLWFETRDDGSRFASLRFRFRVGLLPGATAPSVMGDYLASVFPETKWSKVASKYGSLLGSVDTYAPLGSYAHIRNALEVNEGPEKIFDYMIESLRPMDFGFSKADFVALLWDLINEELAAWENVSKAANLNVISFSTPSGAVSYSEGVPVSTTVVTYPNIPGAGLSPVGPPALKTPSPEAPPEAPQKPTNAPSGLKVTSGGGVVGVPVTYAAYPDEDIESL